MAQLEEVKSKIGALIKKPKLTDNLLNKPPFRFLHDIFTETCKATGFAEGLFEPSYQNAKDEIFKARDAKVEYLQKALDIVGVCNGTHVPMKVSKVVAGEACL